jgi:glycosyltransferase involved in cell wall biosynthesis
MLQDKVRSDKKVSIVYSLYSAFIRRDYDLLSKHFDAKRTSFCNASDISKIIKAVLNSDVSFSWFAGGHAFLAVLFSKALRKGSIVVVGGYDVAYSPELNYGQFTQSWNKKMYTRFALKHADKVLVVDPSLKDDALKNAGVSGRNFEYLPTAYDYHKFKPGGQKEKMALTVATGDSWERVKVKGVDTFVRAAELLPDVKFTIVGLSGKALEKIKEIAPKNVELVGMVSQEEIISYYQRAKVYCQLSMREGLPNALCEAMLCECVPVGTRRNGIPTAIGDCGFYVPYDDPDAAADAINKALGSEGSEDLGKRSRKRIVENFPPERREKRLVQLIEELG